MIETCAPGREASSRSGVLNTLGNIDPKAVVASFFTFGFGC